MQHSANSKQQNGGNSQVQSIIITAITLFALAGAILGFSLGALTHHSTANPQTATNPNSSPNKNVKPTQAATSPTPVPSPTAPAQPLGAPAFTSGTSLAGNYTYTYTLQAKDKSGNLITTKGVTCRLWIAKSNPINLGKTDLSNLKNIASLSQTIPHEVAGGFTFNSATPQTQACVNGLGTWNVNLSTSLAKGTYYIVGLTDWNGTFYNWAWYQFKI